MATVRHFALDQYTASTAWW